VVCVFLGVSHAPIPRGSVPEIFGDRVHEKQPNLHVDQTIRNIFTMSTADEGIGLADVVDTQKQT